MIYSVSALEDINDDSELWGGKAVSISKLKKNGFKVPRGLVVSTEAYELFVNNKINLKLFEEELIKLCESYFAENKSDLIFRSSANIEGNKHTACCGVFESFIYDPQISLVQNVQKVWNSAKTIYAKQYLEKTNCKTNKIKMAVIVQEVIKERFNAVIQTYDIVNRKERIILEYSSGDLDSVVNGFKDAYTVYLDYSGNVKTYQKVPMISSYVIKKLIHDCKLVEDIFNSPVEIEAQIGFKDIYYLQARNI